MQGYNIYSFALLFLPANDYLWYNTLYPLKAPQDVVFFQETRPQPS